MADNNFSLTDLQFLVSSLTSNLQSTITITETITHTSSITINIAPTLIKRDDIVTTSTVHSSLATSLESLVPSPVADASKSVASTSLILAIVIPISFVFLCVLGGIVFWITLMRKRGKNLYDDSFDSNYSGYDNSGEKFETTEVTNNSFEGNEVPRDLISPKQSYQRDSNSLVSNSHNSVVHQLNFRPPPTLNRESNMSTSTSLSSVPLSLVEWQRNSTTDIISKGIKSLSPISIIRYNSPSITIKSLFNKRSIIPEYETAEEIKENLEYYDNCVGCKYSHGNLKKLNLVSKYNSLKGIENNDSVQVIHIARNHNIPALADISVIQDKMRKDLKKNRVTSMTPEVESKVGILREYEDDIYEAVVFFDKNLEDEISLNVGEKVCIKKFHEDGWCLVDKLIEVNGKYEPYMRGMVPTCCLEKL